MADSDTDKEIHNDRSIVKESQKQALIMADQEDQLKSIGHVVVNIRDIASTMNHELDTQKHQLNEISGKVDDSQSRMKNASNRMKAVLKSLDNEKSAGRCMMILMVVVVLLILLVIFV